MSTTISKKMNKFNAAATIVLTARVAQMKAEGKNIISLNVGEPDFPTPDNIKQAGIKAISEDFTKYTVNLGLTKLRENISRKLKTENNINYSIDEITLAIGAKQALMSSLYAILDDGDEVIIPAPCYLSYPDMVKLAGGVPVFTTLEQDTFLLDVEAIRSKVSPKTKAVMICSPGNPTGAVFTEESLRKLAALAVKHDFFIITDEIYEKFIYGKKHFSIASISEDVRQRTITINGFSKTYSMTGWRIGYAAARADIIAAINKIHSQQITCVSGFIQMAAIEALEGPQDSIEIMRAEYEKRRNFCYKRLSEMPGIYCPPADGAFYLFPDISEFINKGIFKSDLEFCEYILEKAGVAIMPGSAYFCPDHIRISFANSMEILEQAMIKIENVLKSLL